MDSKNSLRWIEHNNLGYYCRSCSKLFERVLKTCLNAGSLEKEKALVIGDFGIANQNIAATLSYAYYLAAKKIGMNSEIVLQSQKTRGDEADSDIVRAIGDLPNGSVLVVNVSDRLGSIGRLGKSFRRYCKEKRIRYLSTPSLGYLDNENVRYLLDAIDIDYGMVAEKHSYLKREIDNGKKIRITTNQGTDVVFDVGGVKAIKADGLYSKGLGGNLPAGEVYLPPRNTNGTVVIDASSRNRHSTRKTSNDPIILEIKDNRVVSIKGGRNAAILEKTLSWAEQKAVYSERVRLVGELGIGLNPKARVIGATILDEKALGTAHIAIGSNHWFGGDNATIVHLDQVFYNPRIEIDGEEVRV